MRVCRRFQSRYPRSQRSSFLMQGLDELLEVILHLLGTSQLLARRCIFKRLKGLTFVNQGFRFHSWRRCLLSKDNQEPCSSVFMMFYSVLFPTSLKICIKLFLWIWLIILFGHVDSTKCSDSQHPKASGSRASAAMTFSKSLRLIFTFSDVWMKNSSWFSSYL